MTLSIQIRSGGLPLIALTRLNGRRFVLNAELIRQVEENPDTVITLVSGEHVVVRESVVEVVERSLDYRRHLRCGLPPASAVADGPIPARP